MERKNFKITFSLKEGYHNSGKQHSLDFAENVITAWMTERLHRKQPIISGFLHEGKLFFPSEDPKRPLITVERQPFLKGNYPLLKM